MGDRRVFEHKAYSVNNIGSGDRFIPSRKKLNVPYAHHMLMNKHTSNNQIDIFEQVPRARGVKSFNEVLNETMKGTMWANRKIYDFSIQSSKPQLCDRASAEQGTWPCQPRSRPLMKTPDHVLDLPGYGDSVYPDLIGWGKKDVLIAAINRQIYIWSSVAQNVSSLSLKAGNTTCCAFEPSGDSILASNTTGLTHLFDMETRTNTESYWCAASCHCEVTAVAWSPTGRSFISGCQNGRIRVVAVGVGSKGSMIAEKADAHAGRILRVRVAPSARYVATCAIDVSVRVWLWPCLTPFFEVIYWGIPMAIEWHPWCTRTLAVGASRMTLEDTTTPVLAMWDIMQSVAISSILPKRAYSLDNIVFSDKTGELVGSYWIDESQDDNPAKEPESRLLVMADEERIVDRSLELRGRVRSMILSPDGTRLGTATSEEDLIIWPFLTDVEVKKKKCRKSLAAIPVLLDTMEDGFSIR